MCMYLSISIDKNVSIFRRIRVNSRGLDGSKVDGPSTWNVWWIYPSANVSGDGTLVPFQDRYTICLYSDEFGLRSADIQKPFQPHTTRRYHYHHRSTPHSYTTNTTPQHVSPIDTQRMTMYVLTVLIIDYSTYTRATISVVRCTSFSLIKYSVNDEGAP